MNAVLQSRAAALLLKGLMWPLAALLAWVPADGHGQEVQPDFYREPGLYPNRDSVNQHAAEHVDPFAGALQLHFVDINIPGPAGFDLSVTRSYNSNTFINPAAEPALQSGIGWTMHFGRVLMRGATNPCVNRLPAVTYDNPVLELPDGSRQIFYGSGTSPSQWITTERWRATCLGAGTGLLVWSPAGVRYEMTHAVTELIGASVAASNYAWYARSVTDRNGNSISVNYAAAQSPRIASVTANDGRSLTFGYSGCANGQHVCSITGPNSTWSYEYQLVPNTSNRYFLTAAVRPDGTAWRYAYNGNIGPTAGSYLLNRLTYPQGGTVSYAYAFVNFSNPGNPAGGTAVVSGKSTSDGGNWSFFYTPGGFGVNDQTVVNTPAGSITYQHVGAGTVGSGNVWRIGLLLKTVVGGVQTEDYAWEANATSLSSESNSRPGNFSSKVDSQVLAPQLTNRTVTRNSTTYSTARSAFDIYGNPGQIVEAGPNGGSRTTSLTYYVDPANWILRQVDDETTVGVGAILRGWDSRGRLLSESRDGVVTSYTYHATGDVASVTKPRSLVSSYSSYLRGIPQSEAHPESVTIARVVSAAGNITSETNGENRTTGYSYDGLNRLTAIQPPLGNSTSIAYTGATQKAATRGSLSVVTAYDGFGRVSSETVGGITTTYSHDPLGRKTFQSNPSSASGTRFAHDILGRVVLLTHSDSATRAHTYTGSQVTARNERNAVTTYSYRAYGDPDKSFLMSTSAPVAAASLSIGRNGRDLVTSITQDGITRNFGYDSRYYLTSTVHPETGTTLYGRDAAGNMTSRTVGGSGATVFAYDGRDRLTTTTYPSAATPNVSRVYSRTDKLRTITTSEATRTLGYDANDNLVNESLVVAGITLSATYGYNANDQLSSITYPRSNLTVQLSPDVLGRATTVGSYVTGVTYWPNGQVNRITYGNGATSVYGQDGRLRPQSVTAQSAGTTLINSTFGYDAIGNLTSVTDSVDASYVRGFGYDALDRLTTANGPWGSGSVGYSGGGNIINMSLGTGYSLSFAYSNNRLSSTSGTRSVSYGYDVYGNVSSANSATYSYDDASNLRTCTFCAAGGTMTHRYDGGNARVSTMKAGTTTYEFWSATGLLLAEFVPAQSNALTEYFYLAGKRVAQRTGMSKDRTTTALTATPNPVELNAPATLRATVSGGAPTGAVTFRNGSTVLGSSILSGGVASLTVSFSTEGTVSLTAEYPGSAMTEGSISAAVLLSVVDSRIPTTTTLAASPSPATIEQPVTWTANVAGGATTGTVEFIEAATSLGSVALSGSTASLSQTYPQPGARQLLARFSGNATHKPSTSATVALTVGKLSSNTSLSVVPANPLAGQLVTLSATVTGSSPSGSVRFSRVTSGLRFQIADVALSGSLARTTTTLTEPVTHTIEARYLSDARHTESSASTPVPVLPSGAYGPIQSILKLRNAATEVNTPAMLSDLSSIAQATVTYVRVMSGGAHVVGITVRAGDTYDATLSRLRAGALVEYVEEDQAVRHFSSRRSATVNGAGTASVSYSFSTNPAYAPHTFSGWTLVAGGGVTVSGQLSATFSASLAVGATAQATFEASVRDVVGRNYTHRVEVTLTSRLPLALSISPSPLYGSGSGWATVTRSATATVSGGTPPYAYQWTPLEATAMSVSGASTATATFTGEVVGDWCYPLSAYGVFRLQVGDAAGASASTDLTVSFTGSPVGPPPAQCEAPWSIPYSPATLQQQRRSQPKR